MTLGLPLTPLPPADPEREDQPADGGREAARGEAPVGAAASRSPRGHQEGPQRTARHGAEGDRGR